MSEIKPTNYHDESDFEIFADMEALEKEISQLKVEIARIEKQKLRKSSKISENKQQVDKVANSHFDTSSKRQSETAQDVEKSGLMNDSNPDWQNATTEGWDFSSEFESVEVYEEKPATNKEKHIQINQTVDEPEILNLKDDEIVQVPEESEELTALEIEDSTEIVDAPRQVSPPKITPITDSEVAHKQKPAQAPPRKVYVRKKNDAAIIKELGIGEGQKSLNEARNSTNSRTYYIRAAKPDSPKIMKKLLKALAELHYDNINLAKIEIDVESAKPYLIIGKSLTRRQAHAIIDIMRKLKIPGSVKPDQQI